ncbi:hypothetical protein [Candidatus Amarobacter glycogenicus]
MKEENVVASRPMPAFGTPLGWAMVRVPAAVWALIRRTASDALAT